MKKITSLFISVCLTLLMCVCAHAAAGEIGVYLKGYSGVDGEKISFDIPPQNVNGRTMVPIRAIFEAMGATVNWDDATQTAICTKDSTVVKMTLNSTTEYINDVPVTMDVTPVIISGRTLAPARYVAEAFGYNVKWDEMTRLVLISKDTNYSSADVVDGTREHPYKLGDTISFTFYYYNKATGNCTLTLSSLLSPDEMSTLRSPNDIFYFSDNIWFIKGHIKLNEYSEINACNKDEIIRNAEAVTSKFKPIGNYMWYSSPAIMDYGIDLYSGGETDCYIPLYPDNLSEGETIDYFTITYRSGNSYDDTKTVWFSLK